MNKHNEHPFVSNLSVTRISKREFILTKIDPAKPLISMGEDWGLDRDLEADQINHLKSIRDYG